MLTESRRRTCKSNGGSGRLGARTVEDGGDMRRVAEDAYGVCYSRTVWWFGPQTIGRTVFGFGPQNLGGGSKEERGGTWRNYKGYVEAKQICAGSEAVRSIEIRLYHNFALKYLGAQVKLCNKPINKMGLPPLSVTSWTFSFPRSSPPPRVCS